ncbi:CG8813 [Drosophila busckii]|uniref:CG8813 n=2 Tax=Drosophila busckii TaxID=30019 RepID=A0A0M4E9V4_DROBS|nr:CG8813 [Drosophila busckii]
MMLSTYQHDYVQPNTKRYDFMMHVKGKDGYGGPKIVECQCIEEDKIKPPPDAVKNCAVEWTGIAPMGRLVDPRLIPTAIAKEQADQMAFAPESDCFKLQPNRFLKILRTVYPDLYERLKSLPKEELSRRLEQNRMYTTYQIDYCDMKEYPEGIYESLKPEDEVARMKSDNLMSSQPPCSEFRSNVMQQLERENKPGYEVKSTECEKAYKPFKASFGDSSQFVNSGNNSHWKAASSTFRKVPNFTEYMDSIGRNGCIIMRNKLHDHSK